MSRIGKKIVLIPAGVVAEVQGNLVKIKGPKGQISKEIPKGIKTEIQDGKGIRLSAEGDSVKLSPLHGLARSICFNMVEGVTKGFTKDLEIQGVGYRAKLDGKNLELALGFTHPVIFPIPEGIKIAVEEQVRIKISGADKQLVGEVAACIRRYLPPEPYKGKGIRYAGEVVRKKAGKTVA